MSTPRDRRAPEVSRTVGVRADVSELVRSARAVRGISQRELARRAGVGHGIVGDIEGGRRSPSWALLCRLVAACDLAVSVVAPVPPLTPEQRDYLRVSTSDRLRHAVWHPADGERPRGPLTTWGQLSDLARTVPTRLAPMTALGIWAPVSAPRPVPVEVAEVSALDPTRWPSLELRAAGPPRSALIPIGTTHRDVLIPTPAALALEPETAAYAPVLRAVAAALHVDEGRDRAGRKRPAHRVSDPEREGHEIQMRHGYGRITTRPSSEDRREWRLHSVIGLPDWLSKHRYLNPRDHWAA